MKNISIILLLFSMLIFSCERKNGADLNNIDSNSYNNITDDLVDNIIDDFADNATDDLVNDIISCSKEIGIETETSSIIINGITLSFPIYFSNDLTVDGKSFIIYEIDENKMMRYDEIYIENNTLFYEEKFNDFLLDKLYDRQYIPYLRLSNIFNYINNILDFDEITLGNFELYDIKHLDLLYGLSFYDDYRHYGEVTEIVGRPDGGGGYSIFYIAMDRQYLYTLDLGHFIYTVQNF